MDDVRTRIRKPIKEQIEGFEKMFSTVKNGITTKRCEIGSL